MDGLGNRSEPDDPDADALGPGRGSVGGHCPEYIGRGGPARPVRPAMRQDNRRGIALGSRDAQADESGGRRRQIATAQGEPGQGELGQSGAGQNPAAAGKGDASPHAGRCREAC